jgi:hypothetical protein
VIELRETVDKMNRAAEFYQTVARKTAAKRDRQAAIVLKHAANVSASPGRQEYDGARIQDVLEAADEKIHRTDTYDVMDKAEEVVDDDFCRVKEEPRSSPKNTRLIVDSPTELPETIAGLRIHEGVLRE